MEDVKTLKTFIVNRMPVPTKDIETYVKDFIQTNKTNPKYSHLFENQNQENQTKNVVKFLEDEAEIIRPCSFYVFSQGVGNLSLFVSDEYGKCMLVGNTDNILPKSQRSVTALAVSKSMLRIEHPPYGMTTLYDFSIDGYFSSYEGFIRKKIIISGYWEYNTETHEITFPENQYIEMGKIYNLSINFESPIPEEYRWLREFTRL